MALDDCGAAPPPLERTGARLLRPVGLARLPGEGRTLVAREGIPAGSRVLLERPLAVAPSREALQERLAALFAADDGALSPAIPSETVPVAEDAAAAAAAVAVSRFSFEFLDGATFAFFPVIGVVNHACARSVEANCCLSVPFDAGAPAEGEEAALVAVRAVAAGEPLRMPYLCPFAPPAQLAALQQAHAFTCRCSACAAPPLTPVDVGAAPRGCAGCGRGGDEVALSRCSGCRRVLYCGAACQRSHRREHRPLCAGDGGAARLLARAGEAYDAAMAASEAALGGAGGLKFTKDEAALRRRFDAELALEDSLQAAHSFLAAFVERGPPAIAPHHTYAHYLRGNFAKQALCRLHLRRRPAGAAYVGREPRGGCGALSLRARRRLEGCLAAALGHLPRFHVEVLSLLRDVADLRHEATVLQGLAGDLAASGEPDEGEVSEAGLDEVVAWASETLESFRDVLEAYGEAPDQGG